MCAAVPAAGCSAGESEQGALGLGEQPAGRFQGAVRVCKQQLAARASTASPSKWRAPAHVCSFAGSTDGIMDPGRSWDAYEGGRPAGARGDGRPAGGRQVPPPRRANGARYWKPGAKRSVQQAMPQNHHALTYTIDEAIECQSDAVCLARRHGAIDSHTPPLPQPQPLVPLQLVSLPR